MELCKKADCTGCGACYNACPRQAIQMIEDHEGFLFPSIDSHKCVDCQLCTKACPVLFPVRKHPAVRRPIAAIAKDMSILTKSSSGGMFSLLAERFINDGGVVYGAVMEKNGYVHHVHCDSPAGIAPMRGSKYVQSNTELTYSSVKAHLKAGYKVMYTGTPCQIAGLRKYLGASDTSNLLCVDIVCHGVPSNAMFRMYLQRVCAKKGVNVDDIVEIRFRNYEKWGGFYLLLLLFDGRIIICERQDNIYLSLFLQSYTYRESCYHCSYASHERVSDVTIADFWSIGAKSEFVYDTSKGCSLLLLNTKKGERMLSEIGDRMYHEQRTWDEADLTNHQLYRPAILPKRRSQAIKSMNADPLDKTYDLIYNTPYLRIRRLVGKILRALNLR